MSSIEHWMQFGTFAQKDFFEYPEVGTYQGVLINANMVAYAPGGIAAFLQERRAGGKYIIDPLTHAFQHDPALISDGEGKTKSSLRSLADHYGGPIEKQAGKRPLRPSDLDPKTLEALVASCLTYQRDYLPRHMATSDAAKYLEDDATQPPYALVAPYFFITESTVERWLPVCISAIRSAKAGAKRGERVFGAVVVSQGIVTDSDERERIIKEFSASGADGFLLWVDDLDEISAGKLELQGLVQLAAGLRGKKQREVINTHGGYFSILAAGSAGNSAMSGVAHGPEFGEFRSVVPVGGGIPIARYYIPRLHARIRYRDALRMFIEKKWLASAKVFHAEVCNCPECKRVIDGDPAQFKLFGQGNVKSVRRKHGIVRIEFPTRDASLACLKHYLERKKKEYDGASAAPREELLKELQEGADIFEEVSGLDGVAHLRLWARVLSAVDGKGRG